MNRTGALKLTAILIVLVLCISSVGMGLLLANKGSSSVTSVDASTVPTGNPLNTGESSSIPGSSSGVSNDLQLQNNNYFNGNSPQLFLSGNYAYRANYDNDCTGEIRVSSSTSTVLGATSIIYGQSVRDNATVTGQENSKVPTGTVNFQVKIGNGAWNTYSHEVLLSQGSAVSAWYTPVAPGNYYFRAVYNGDSSFFCSQSGNYDECLYVGKASTTTTTILGASDITRGRSVTDNATVTGLGAIFSVPAGTVIFKVLVPGALDFVPYGSVKTLDACGKAISDSYTPQMTGTYYFQAVYSGDCKYLASTSGIGDEPLIVCALEMRLATVTTQLSDLNVLAGFPVTDTAFVTSGSSPVPTGTVTFEFSHEGGPWTAYGSVVELVAGQAESDYLYTTAGHYEFRAVYSGDTIYLGATSAEGSEPLDVCKNPSFTDITVIDGPSITLGDSVYVSATVPPTGRFAPTGGCITFQVSYECGSFVTFDIQPLETATSVAYTPLAAGHYEFQAVFSGDRDYLGSTSPEGYGPLDVAPASSGTSTDLGASSIILGQSVTDNATVEGLGGDFPTPTGTVTFYVSSNDGTTWTMVGLGPVALDCEGKAMSDWYMPMTPGEYLFKAVYNGDINYLPSESDPCSEPLHVDPAPSEPNNDFDECPPIGVLN
jgi:hypothetical protein